MPLGAQGHLLFSDVQTHRFALSLPNPVTLTLELLYFPGWQATLDNTPIAVEPHPGNGLLDVQLPAGAHVLTVHFGETPLRLLADIISIISWLGLALFIAWRLARKIISR